MSKTKPALPNSYVNDDGMKVVHYRTKPGNDKKHVYINDDDNTYIYHCIIRLIAEVGEKQFINAVFFEEFMKKDSSFSVSSYNAGKFKPKPNSIFSYASGLVSNWLRNPSQDFTVKQLPKIEVLTTVIHNLYKQQILQVGYNYATNKKNAVPLQIKFVEA